MALFPQRIAPRYFRLDADDASECPKRRPLPMTATTAPISTTAEQEQHQDDNQDQFHGDFSTDGDGADALRLASPTGSSRVRSIEGTTGRTRCRLSCQRDSAGGHVGPVESFRQLRRYARRRLRPGLAPPAGPAAASPRPASLSPCVFSRFEARGRGAKRASRSWTRLA